MDGMSLISLQDVNLAFSQQVLFQAMNLTIDADTNYALIGPNGSGKSSLLKLLTGELLPDSGTCHVAKNCLLSYLSQQPLQMLDDLQYVYENRELQAAEKRMRELELKLAAAPNAETDLTALMSAYHQAQIEFERLGGFSFEAEFKAACSGLNLPVHLLERRPETLSGGEKMKVALAHCLLSPADLILLDEPTNHLDVSAAEWLANFIVHSKKSFIVVSHDRFFLDQITDKTLIIEKRQINCYPGNYTEAKKLRDEQIALQARELANLLDKLEHEEAVKQTFLSHRNISGYHAREKVVDSLTKKVKQLQAERPEHKTLRFSFNQPGKLGTSDAKRVLLTVKDLSKAYGKVLFDKLALTLRADDKIALLGENGSGKTTLLKILLGEELPDGGEIKLYGDLQIAYMGQVINFVDETCTLLEYLAADNTVPERYLRAQLARYGFPTELMDKPLSTLSGGERHRIYLAKLLNAEPDILFLDEPTNHLDLDSIEQLEQAIAAYQGAVVLVSHDRYFVNKIAANVYGFVQGEFSDFLNYDAWRQAHKAASAPATSHKTAGNAVNNGLGEAKLKMDDEKISVVEQKSTAPPRRRVSNAKIRAVKVAGSETLQKLLDETAELEAVNEQFLQTNSSDVEAYAAYNERLLQINALENSYLSLAERYEHWLSENSDDEAVVSALETLIKEARRMLMK